MISSDFCRGLVADDENDQSATPDAFDVLHYIVGTRLRRGLLTVVDATNVQRLPGPPWSKLAKEHDVLVDAIVLDVPESRRDRAQRDATRPRLRRPRRHAASTATCKRSLGRMRKEGFRRVHVLARRRRDRRRRRSPASGRGTTAAS